MADEERLPRSTRSCRRTASSIRLPAFVASAHVARPVDLRGGRSATRRRSGRGFAVRARVRNLRRGRQVLDWTPPHAKWFVGGTLNASVNCLDRHVRWLAPQQGRVHLGRGARRLAHHHVLGAVPRRLPVRQRARVAGHPKGRSRRALPATHPRAGHRDARLRRTAAHSVVLRGFSAGFVCAIAVLTKASAGAGAC